MNKGSTAPTKTQNGKKVSRSDANCLFPVAKKQRTQTGPRGRQIAFFAGREYRLFLLTLLLGLFFFSVSPSRGGTFSISTDELSCGQATVRAVSTCAEGQEDTPACTDQHFFITDKTTKTTARLKTSGDPITERLPDDTSRTWLWGLARKWACMKGTAGSYMVLEYTKGGTCETCIWHDIYDLKGNRIASDKKNRTERDLETFRKEWDSLGLPHYWPWNSYVEIKLFKGAK
jgi:hypothetical protein